MLTIYSGAESHTAVIEDKQHYTYGRFISDTDALKRFLNQNTVRKTAIIAPQGYLAYCAIWAVYLTGGTFCCINNGYPEKRIMDCLSLFKPDLVLTSRDLPEWDECDIQRLGPELFQATASDSEPGPFLPNEIAFVLFTSGTTGVPKGVRIRRDALEEVIHTAIHLFELSPADIGGQFSDICFDMGICDVFSMLCAGSSMVVIGGTKKLLPAAVIEQERITFWYSVPNVLDLMARRSDISASRLSSLRCIAFGGATLFANRVEELFAANPRLTVINTYGPTEITIFSSAVRMNANNYLMYCDGSVCIGTQIENVLQTTRDDSTGWLEVVIKGDHIMDGYLSLENCGCAVRCLNLTEFATGDLVREHAGQLYFVQRKDSQTKIFGNRVDLSEIDAVVRRMGVENEVVIAVNDQLVLFVERCGNITEESLRARLRETLAPYAVPRRIEMLDSMLYNRNGKYDRVRLTDIAKRFMENE